MRISTWNINSIRLRISSVIEFIKDFNIDVICLQETKTENKYFPIKPFIDIGFFHFNYTGQKSYNGVAILSKIPFLKKDIPNFCGVNDARHVSVEFDNKIIIHNEISTLKFHTFIQRTLPLKATASWPVVWKGEFTY